MTHERHSELLSLARCVGAEPGAILDLARAAAADRDIRSIHELTDDEAAQIIGVLKILGTDHRRVAERWLENAVA